MQIGAFIGRVKEVDVSGEGIEWGSHLRVKIELDLRKAIARGRTVNLEGNKLWVQLTYEKLPKICFKCGRIKHDKDGCKGVNGKGDRKQYGSWLRASLDLREKLLKTEGALRGKMEGILIGRLT